MTKFTKHFEGLLLQHFAEVYVLDQRGDGHHLELVCIDDCFAEMNRLARSRHIFTCLDDLIQQIHAVTVRGLTPQEWSVQSQNFEPKEYVHFK